jgi:hypothetical protein
MSHPPLSPSLENATFLSGEVRQRNESWCAAAEGLPHVQQACAGRYETTCTGCGTVFFRVTAYAVAQSSKCEGDDLPNFFLVS